MTMSKLDQRIASAEGRHQAESYRRERVEEKLDRRNIRIRELEQDVERLHAAIAAAPHDDDCACGTMMNVEEFYPCSCWKSEA